MLDSIVAARCEVVRMSSRCTGEVQWQWCRRLQLVVSDLGEGWAESQEGLPVKEACPVTPKPSLSATPALMMVEVNVRVTKMVSRTK